MARGILRHDRIVDTVEQNRPHLGTRVLTADHQMQTVESTEPNVGDQEVGRDLIEHADRGVESGRERDFVTAVFQQRHRGRILRFHCDYKDVSHAGLSTGVGVFPGFSK
jgi:hypothetical protein